MDMEDFSVITIELFRRIKPINGFLRKDNLATYTLQPSRCSLVTLSFMKDNTNTLQEC